MNNLKLIEEATRVVLSAGELLAAEWERPGGPRGYGDKADVDIEIEARLRADLLAIMACDFWGEETGSQLTGHEYCWVVDPNDGTSDFLGGRKGSAVSVGLLHNEKPFLGVVYAPVLESRAPDCISWVSGLEGVMRNGKVISNDLRSQRLIRSSQVLVSTAAAGKPELNAELCSPAGFVPMPSIAYRLARVATGDAVACASLVPVSAHDIVAGHALLLGARGVLVDQDGMPVSYKSKAHMARVSLKCFGGAPMACKELVSRKWGKLFSV